MGRELEKGPELEVVACGSDSDSGCDLLITLPTLDSGSRLLSDALHLTHDPRGALDFFQGWDHTLSIRHSYAIRTLSYAIIRF